MAPKLLFVTIIIHCNFKTVYIFTAFINGVYNNTFIADAYIYTYICVHIYIHTQHIYYIIYMYFPRKRYACNKWPALNLTLMLK